MACFGRMVGWNPTLRMLHTPHASADLAGTSCALYLVLEGSIATGFNMSRWSDQFDEISILETLTEVMRWLGVEVDNIDADQETEKRRLTKCVQRTMEIVRGLDPEFFPDQQLRQLNQHLRQPPFWNNVQAYSSSPNAQNLREANDHFTKIAPTIFQIAAISGQATATNTVGLVEGAYNAFCAKLDKREKEHGDRLAEQDINLTNLGGRLDALTQRHRSLEEQAEASLSNWQSKYTQAQTKRAEDFSSAQIDRGTKFDEVVREWRTKSESEIKEISATHEKKLDSAFEAYRADVLKKTEDMDSKHNDVLEIHGLVGTDGVAGGYQKGATDEHKAVNLWRRISMGLLGIAAAWILIKYCIGFDLTSNGQANWPELATEISLTLVLLGAAGYAARQSKLHRETEQHMRWFALEVKAIDPFLSSLPADQQYNLKNQLTQKLFGQNRLTADKSEGNIDPVAFKSVMESFLSLVKALGSR